MFSLDFKGWRRENAGRPLRDLAREVLQNVMDTEATHVRIRLLSRDPDDDYPSIEVEDDDPRGVQEESEITTVNLSGKADQPTKRGRMGRGLKEAISVARVARVISTGCAVEFDCVAVERKRLRTRRDMGTLVKLVLPKGRRAELAEVVALIKEILWPEGMHVSASLDGVEIQIRVQDVKDSYDDIKLPTVVLEDEGWRETSVTTTVRILPRHRATGGVIHEMGIPIEENDQVPFDIDVCQRIPMNPRRDTVKESYRKKLYKAILERRATGGKLTESETASGYVDLVIGEIESPKALDGVLTARFGTPEVVRSDAFDSYANVVAQDVGKLVVATKAMSESWRKALRNKQTAHEVAKEVLGDDPDREGRRIDPVWQPKFREPTSSHDKGMVEFFAWLAEQFCPTRKFTVQLVENRYPKISRLMDVSPVGLDEAVIRVFIPTIPFYLKPICASGIAVIAHEVSHLWNRPGIIGHVGAMIRQVENLTGRAGWVLFTHRDYIHARWPSLIADADEGAWPEGLEAKRGLVSTDTHGGETP